MKIQIDSTNKIIRIDEVVGLGEMVKMLEKLLPKDSPIGYWKDFKLETNTVIYNWSNPIIYGDKWWLSPTYPTYPISPVYCGNGTNDTIVGMGQITSTVFNVELN